MEEKKGRCLVLSGGGAFGSYAVGLLKAWNRDYAHISGISTGALISPLAGLKKWDALVEGYTSVDLDSVFNVSPFRKNGKVRVAHSISRFARGKNSVGEMYPLRDKLIPKFYSREDHEELRRQGKEILVHALNIGIKPSVLETFSNLDTEYEVFTQAMFASCCFAPVSNVATVRGMSYVDGGFVETITIDEVLERGYRDIDVIVLRPKHEVVTLDEPRNMVELAERLLNAMRYDIAFENLNKAIKLASKDPDVSINVYYTPYTLSDNAMNFDKKQMQSWVKLGEQNAFNPEFYENYSGVNRKVKAA